MHSIALLLVTLPGQIFGQQACYPLVTTDPLCGFLGSVSTTITGTASTTISGFTSPEEFFCPSIPLPQLQMLYCMAAMGACNGQQWSLPSSWNIIAIGSFYRNAQFSGLLTYIAKANGQPMCYDACHAALSSVQSCWEMKAINVGTNDLCAGLPTTNCASLPGPLVNNPSQTGNLPSPSPTNSPGGTVVGPTNPGSGGNPVSPTFNTPTGLLNGNATCPVCADCRKAGCSNFGTCGGTGTCACPVGFGGPDCSQPLCSSPIIANSVRKIRPTTDPCVCDNGFIGPNCNVCMDDNACQTGGSSLGSVSSNVCNTSPEAWVAQSAVCVTDVPALQTVYNGTSTITLFRNITSGNALGSLWYNNVEQFMCQFLECDQILVPDDHFQYQYQCSQTKCVCSRASAFCGGPGVVVDLTTQISGATGAFSFKCESVNSTVCNASFDFLKGLFPNGMSLPACSFGECSDPKNNPFLALLNSQPKPLSVAEISSISVVSAVVAALLGGLVWAYLQQVKAKKAPRPAALTGLTLSFSDIDYTLRSGKQILYSVSGVAPAGQVMAILGPSGAGKSSLLDIIAGKQKVGSTSGVIKLDGVPVDPERLRNLVGYVDQDDLLLPTMTVRETLMFSASLRLPESMSTAEKMNTVDEVLHTLGLSHVADTKVGGFGQRGISGGERRRVSIGIELVTSPAVILLDEPTSGLDAHSAHMLIQNLTTLAHKQGKTVIFTIHQPRSDIFSLFDQLVILSRGQPLYCGPGSHEVVAYFASVGQPCPEDYNMADHMLDVAANAELSASIVKNARISKTEVHASAEQHAALLNRLKQFGEGKVGFMTQLTVLMGRAFKTLVRTPSLLFAHVIMAIVMGVFIGGAYFQSGVTLLGIQNRMGSVLFILSLIGFSSLSAIGSFSIERNLFMRERSNRMYGSLPYLISKIVFDIVPLRLLPGFIIGIITFFMIGFTNDSGSFAKFISLLLVFSAEMGVLCLCLGITIAEVGTATLVGAILILFKMLFAGFLINQDSIPPAMIWIQYLSFFKYPYEGLVITDLAQVTIVDEFDNAKINIPATLIIEKFGLNINKYTTDFLVSVGILIALVGLMAGLIHFRLKERR